jgi:hypothetical protein
MKSWHTDTCPGSGKPPRQLTDIQLDTGTIWTVGVCAVCARGFCAITRSGTVRAHKRWDDKPSLDNISATLRAAQELLAEAVRALETFDS